MTRHNENLNEEVIRKQARADFWSRAGTYMERLFLIVVLILILLDLQAGNEARHAILDCTKPEGQCSQENAKETAKIVADIVGRGHKDEKLTRQLIIDASSAAAWCAKQPQNDNVAKTEKCTRSFLTNEGRK